MAKFMKYFLLLMTLVFIVPADSADAQPATSFDKPVKLRVTGTLHPDEKQPREDLVMVNILVEDKPLLLRVGKVEEITHSEREQAVKWGVLLRQVRFYGPTELISQLQEGKALTIEGQLDTKGRQFLVSNVKEATGTQKESPIPK
jgi:hypothetical protein